MGVAARGFRSLYFNFMKPYIICHMMSSVDGRIDCAMTEHIDPTDSYYEALEELQCPTYLMGRVTMQMHYAESEPFVPSSDAPIGQFSFHKAQEALGYTVAVDTMGKLKWPSYCYDGKPLVVITSERCPKEYLDTLTSQKISWIAIGKEEIDLPAAVNVLNTEFGVTRMAVLGGGHINGAFLEKRLLDEVSLMIGSGIDGRKGMAAVFDGIANPDFPTTLLHLNGVKQVNEYTVWLRYTIKTAKE